MLMPEKQNKGLNDKGLLQKLRALMEICGNK